jgi:hypothetical protein
MANLARVRAAWSGTPVIGGGVSTFYFDESGEGWVADVRSFFVSCANRIPTAISVQVESTGDLVDVATGALTGVWSEDPVAAVPGTALNPFAQGVGARVVWATTGIHNRRRVKGSTFLAPLDTNVLTSGGLILGAVADQFLDAADTLVASQAGNMKIYSRPVGGAGGAASTVVSASVPSSISWLRSRRT